MQFVARDTQGFGLACRFRKQLFDMAELVFAQELLVVLGDKTAFALHGADKPELLQVGVGALVVMTLTPRSLASARMLGSLAPAASVPERIWALTCEVICS